MSTRFSLSSRLSFLFFAGCAVLMLQSVAALSTPEQEDSSSSQSASAASASAPVATPATSEKGEQDTTSIAKTIGNVVAGTLFPTLPNIPVPDIPTQNVPAPNVPANPAGIAAPQTGNRVLDTSVQRLEDASYLPNIAARLKLPLPLPKGRIVVLKSRRRLELWNDGQLVKAYGVALGANPVGAKTQQHDNRTPEGHFTICTRNAATSAFHIFLGLSYPGLPDAARGANRGTITWREYALIQRQLASRGAPPWETRLGGWVGIHGGTGSAFAQNQAQKRGRSDWTAGCVALTDSEIEELYSATKIGTPVWIRP